MNPTIKDISERLARNESLVYISEATGISQDWIRKAFSLNK